jgi:hypothetical protein
MYSGHPSAIVDPLSCFVHSIYSFFLLSVLEFCPYFLVLLVDFGFLHNWPRNPRSIFLGPFFLFSVLGSQEQKERSHMNHTFRI